MVPLLFLLGCGNDPLNVSPDAGGAGKGGAVAGGAGGSVGGAGGSVGGAGAGGSAGNGGDGGAVGGAGGLSREQCDALKAQYATALGDARGCSPGAADPCPTKITPGLGCPGCTTFVRTDAQLVPLASMWNAGKCARFVQACPGAACAPPPTRAECVATAVGSAQGMCRDVVGAQVCNQACMTGRTCCGGGCVNTSNDPRNCGGCGRTCSGDRPFCAGGTCTANPCQRDGGTCAGGGACCGTTCCAAGQLCCDVEGPVGGIVQCHTPTADQPTCPQGCAPLCVSDRNAKHVVGAVDAREVLDQVSRLPLARWRYRDEPDGVQHLGPMAQDFRSVLGLGDRDTAYHAVDAHGVTIAAIQALRAMLDEQSKRIDALERRNRELERRARR
jgi:hypothetical protein